MRARAFLCNGGGSYPKSVKTLDLCRARVYNHTVGRITDIARQKRNTSRVSVFIDGEFVCGLDAVTAVAARLKIGDEITVDALKAVVFDSEVNSAFERAVSYLSRSPRSRREIERYLRDKDYDKAVAEKAVERLDSYGYTDDRAYAELYIKSRSARYGRFRLAAELRQKGVDGAIIDELLDDGVEDATAAARKYLRVHRSADVQKLKRFLAGRGFSWDAVFAAVSDVADEFFSGGDDDEDR